jgi:hypothetical protein
MALNSVLGPKAHTGSALLGLQRGIEIVRDIFSGSDFSSLSLVDIEPNLAGYASPTAIVLSQELPSNLLREIEFIYPSSNNLIILLTKTDSSEKVSQKLKLWLMKTAAQQCIFLIPKKAPLFTFGFFKKIEISPRDQPTNITADVARLNHLHQALLAEGSWLKARQVQGLFKVEAGIFYTDSGRIEPTTIIGKPETREAHDVSP